MRPAGERGPTDSAAPIHVGVRDEGQDASYHFTFLKFTTMSLYKYSFYIDIYSKMSSF